jgi:uncharacterized membrane protein YjfL (UPF0719 family)
VNVSVVDLVGLPAIAFVAQIAAYGAAARFVPHLRKSIEYDHVASGILLAALAIGIRILSAAAMSL